VVLAILDRIVVSEVRTEVSPTKEHKTLECLAWPIIFVIMALAGSMIYSFYASNQAHRHRIE